ncbi:ATP-binding protein [Mesobacillus jeotgali]|uniref:ATP-binding protein n=1 Tax=Mesobacillus jeotgali TaxID=129985 RepID=UPI001CFC5D18|nr:sensor histidine kinase [Mesobacillus jeotgali]
MIEKKRWGGILKERLILYLLIMIAVPIGGEMKFYPFEGEMRVSLGTPIFFFILLWSKKLHPLLAGVAAGSAVVLFRVVLFSLTVNTNLLFEGFLQHFPVFFYYLTFALLFYLFKINTLFNRPFLVGLLGVIVEVTASMMEIFFRSFISQSQINLETFLTIGMIAIIRSFFVLGFFNIFVIREAKLSEDQQRNRNEQMLMLISNLYVEMIQLKKTMKNAEELTAVSYTLYRELKEKKQDEHAHSALKIAGELHEIKKDNQRIYAGLTKLMVKENISDFMDIEGILKVITKCNGNYAESLGKSIEFTSIVAGEHPPYHTFMLLSVINNLATNAVEAIHHTGDIRLDIARNQDTLVIQVKDTGPGIDSRNRQHVFEPGFTTKFSQEGNASNGIGLSYVKSALENIGGKIILEPYGLTNGFNTVFIIEVPIGSLTLGG